ncbi:MAG: DNA polymerase IV [Anaerolineales bacterium]
MVERWIIHADLDAFFASVEQLLNPALRGKPLIVGGDPQRRGVVAAASYPARAYGVRSAMPVTQALRLCPQATVVPARHREYERFSSRIMDILYGVSPVVEKLSIDEAFLDVSACMSHWESPEALGKHIQGQVAKQEHLPMSLGIATSKLVAKIACDQGKPRGLLVVDPGEEQEFLAPLPIRELWGVGEVMAARLEGLGVEVIGDLTAWTEEQLVDTFGKVGHRLYWAARGIDDSEVQIRHRRRSISQEMTFVQDTVDLSFLHRRMLDMSEKVAARLRRDGLVTQTIWIKVRYADFTTFTRQLTLEHPTDRADVIDEVSRQLLDENWQRTRPLRLLGVGVSSLVEESGYQLRLFDRSDQRRVRLNRALDDIRNKFGPDAIGRASLYPTSSKEDQENASQS